VAVELPDAEPAEPPRKTLAGLLELAGCVDHSESQPWTASAPQPALAYEVQALRAEVQHLRQRLGDLERVQGQMAVLLDRMGMRVGMA
jgi:hypothetical protein